jgi:S1-C subfamily serine protease
VDPGVTESYPVVYTVNLSASAARIKQGTWSPTPIQAGIRPFDPHSGTVGDIIVAADGQRTQTAAALAAVFEDAGVGQDITLKIVRGDAEREVEVRLIDLGT